ncbi:hypothetical protein LI129_23270, partial [Erysipelatoclostridium ramosum]|nr:hypothetical protein [Thomasclavelia ramosa]
KGKGLRHPYVNVKDKTLVTLYDAGNGSSGQYRVFEVKKALQSDDMPDIQQAREASEVAVFLSFDARVQTVSDMI